MKNPTNYVKHSPDEYRKCGVIQWEKLHGRYVVAHLLADNSIHEILIKDHFKDDNGTIVKYFTPDKSNVWAVAGDICVRCIFEEKVTESKPEPVDLERVLQEIKDKFINDKYKEATPPQSPFWWDKKTHLPTIAPYTPLTFPPPLPNYPYDIVYCATDNKSTGIAPVETGNSQCCDNGCGCGSTDELP